MSHKIALIGSVAFILLSYVSAIAKGGVLPTVNTWCYSLQNINDHRTPARADSTLRFWTSHYDILIGCEPRKEIKQFSPTTTVYAYSLATNLTAYNRDNDTYKSDLKILKDWVATSYHRFGYNHPDSAFETCFFHTRDKTIGCKFVKGDSMYIPPYDPSNPKASRIPAAWERNSDWCMNLSSVVYRTYWNEVLVPMYTDGVDGLYLDVQVYPNEQHLPDGGNIREFATNEEYHDSLVKATAAYQDTLHAKGKLLAINNHKYDKNGCFELYQSVDCINREVNIYYYNWRGALKKELDGAMQSRDSGVAALMHHRAEFDDVWPKDKYVYARDRDRIAGLSTYLMAYGKNVYLMSYVGGLVYGLEMDTAAWFDAMACDFGEPLEPYSVWATGIDPSDNINTYEVWKRRFANALVLVKPKPNWDTKKYDETSMTTHALPGKFRRLKVDGTLDSSVIEQISLNNWEGAILIPDTLTNWSAPQIINKNISSVKYKTNKDRKANINIKTQKILQLNSTFTPNQSYSIYNLLGVQGSMQKIKPAHSSNGIFIIKRHTKN